MTMSQALSMGGYGIYVWTTYSLTFLIFAINIINTFQEKRRIKKRVQFYIAESKKTS